MLMVYFILYYFCENAVTSLQMYPHNLGVSTASQQQSTVNKLYKRGIIDYIGDTSSIDISLDESSEASESFSFQKQTFSQLFQTKFKLWCQFPWKKFKRNTILKLKISGSFPLEAAQSSFVSSFGGKRDFESVSSLAELMTLFNYAAYDPRVVSVFIDLGPLTCGYAKLIEVLRIKYYIKLMLHACKP